jgi:hypothetical protein
MNTSLQQQKSHHSHELNSMFLVSGTIEGFLVLLVVSVVFLLGIFSIPGDGIRQGIVTGSLLLLAATIPGTFIGLLVFRLCKKKALSPAALIVVSAASGILGGVISGGTLAVGSLLWLFATVCC